METKTPSLTKGPSQASPQGYVPKTCPVCGADECHTQVNAFYMCAGGWEQATILVCGLCAEEIARGNNPRLQNTKKHCRMKADDPIIDLLHAQLTQRGINTHKGLLGLGFYFGLVITGAIIMATLKNHNII